MAEPNMPMLRQSLEGTLSPFAETRKGSEAYLNTLSSQPNYVLLLLQVLESANEKQEVRLAAALLFKNFIKHNWDPEKQGCVPQSEKNLVKQHLVELMCRMPETLQKQLIEALTTIGEYDFPAQWTDLLAQLVHKLQTEQDWQVRNGVLMTANTIFKRFRNVFKSDDLFRELKHCLEVFQEPLLVFFKETGVALRAPGVAVAQQAQMMTALRYMSRIFYSLNWQDLPEYFEDHIAEWMGEFLGYLSYENPALEDADNEDEPGPIDRLLVAIVENINLYAEKYDEEFKPFLQKFTEVIWNLLANRITLFPKHDELAAKCMKFLTSVASRSFHRALFESPQVLTELCGIVVTNMQLRSSDEELFEDNSMDYIRRDIEGSDGDSRRSAARDLVRGLLGNFDETVTQICMNTIQTHLQQYKADPARNWAMKDVSINLVIAISAIKQSRLRGVSEVNSRVPLMDFFMAEVLPELSTPNQASLILKADAIKFVSTFRSQMPVEVMDQLFPLLMNCMDPSQFVVHTYAAACLERLLTVKDPAGSLRFSKQRLAPYLGKLLEHVFNILEQPNYPENDYLMKVVMRVMNVAKEDILPLTDMAVNKLTSILNRICANPSNPSFSHYLFESLSVLILNVCKTNPAATERFEELLFPPFQKVLTNDVEALSPYVYQVLAQMLELRPSGVSDAYKSMFPVLLNPTLWERVSNVPAIVKLIEAYMRKAPNDVAQSVQGILGVFQKLISSRSTEANAFSLLRALFAFMPREAYGSFLNEIIKILMIRLQTRMAGRNSEGYTKELVYTVSVLIGKLGPDTFLASLESLQKGMSTMFIKSVWLQCNARGRSPAERKACAIGLTRLMCETEFCGADLDMWTEMLIAAVKVLEEAGDSGAAVKDEDESLLELEQTGYEAGYAKLFFASVIPLDYLQEYPVPTCYLAESISKLSASKPGVHLAYAQTELPTPATLTSLQSYFAQNNVPFQ
ncbi:exportin-2-like protein [Phytophthora infestans T30-4]|uniref:Exportin-2-like protein n=1 Tax=Phytophthora infestans (strain T30-4) TaxID=403677 RepID=D0MXR3_PHYIT|nr:exportin-2-like protein [Phytophthora infestans T30-4]EEY65961.1 exportin-2-like protein [Phytophthora infestans T30-4]|eukprot:XP_002906560.1 exportin-2-like protein [Phytophthora infestans T30-4]